MKKNINYVRYENALTDEEILLYAQMINKFKNDEIDFKRLQNMFLNQGVMIEPTLIDFSKKLTTLSEADIIRERISKQNYLYSDIHNFVLNSNRFKNVVFYMDYKAIEVLANFGIPEYQNTLISILKTQLRHSYDKDENVAAERAKWRKKIDELESQLSKSDKFGKSK